MIWPMYSNNFQRYAPHSTLPHRCSSSYKRSEPERCSTCFSSTPNDQRQISRSKKRLFWFGISFPPIGRPWFGPIPDTMSCSSNEGWRSVITIFPGSPVSFQHKNSWIFKFGTTWPGSDTAPSDSILVWPTCARKIAASPRMKNRRCSHCSAQRSKRLSRCTGGSWNGDKSSSPRLPSFTRFCR